MAVKTPLPDAAIVEDTARILRCLGHPARLRILDYLEREGERTVSEIHEALGLGQATASQHLSLMHDKGILRRRKEGVNVFYEIGDARALKVLACIRGSVASELGV
ncbi:MAG: ArsR family transcriptional regulator [Gemmatimonadetes bacterium]|nr:MAG: ArsR family transcriptional regulator [Gemmatimonadota bacterium]